MTSNDIVIAAPMSFTGSAQRLVRPSQSTLVKLLIIIFVLPVAWLAVLGWYCVFGLWLTPYRLMRRGARKNKREQLRHSETLAQIGRQNDGANVSDVRH